jgi:hypothetical protein
LPDVRRLLNKKNQGVVAPTVHITTLKGNARTFVNFCEKKRWVSWLKAVKNKIFITTFNLRNLIKNQRNYKEDYSNASSFCNKKKSSKKIRTRSVSVWSGPPTRETPKNLPFFFVNLRTFGH